MSTLTAESFARLPASLLRVRHRDASVGLVLWRERRSYDLRPLTLDALLALPLAEIRAVVDNVTRSSHPELDLGAVELLAPVESQEVWAAGVTYLRSREARVEESAVKDIYARVYEAERPELFFKAAGWRVVPPGGMVGVRLDSTWDVPEPELAVLSNSRGEVVAYSCGNDMSSRSIEGANPLYLPQAKVYDRSCSLGPVAALAWHTDVSRAEIRMTVERDGVEVFGGRASTGDLVRDPAELVSVLHAAYALPAGAWLLTGTAIVPPESYTARPGDVVRIQIAGLGELWNEVVLIAHSRAQARPRVERA